jgi:hypothetical protein
VSVSSGTGSPEPDPGSPLEEEGMPDLFDALAAKRITGDPQEDRALPAEQPAATVDFGVTVEEMRDGEPLAGRLAREEPDVAALRGDDSDMPYPEDPDERVGRLTASDEPGAAVDVGTDRGGFAPEERAMHDEP